MTIRPLTSRLRSFHQFFQTETAGGALLFLCACTALALANSPWAESYERLWTSSIVLALPTISITTTLQQVINDGLMTIFFLHVGLEIKREFVAGELASAQHAALPIAAAIGGMVMPAALYIALNHTGAEARGWGIPMATDIAFALGALSLVVPNAPAGIKVFLAALAIVDDMGAVIVIALFYTHAVAWIPFAMAILIVIGLMAINALRVRSLTPYLMLGVGLWFFVHGSGVHATIAGVFLAFTIPTTTRINAPEFSEEARRLLDEFDRTETGDYLVLTSKGQQEAIAALGRASEAVTAPLLRLEHALQGLSALVVMPLFALANAGVRFDGAGLGGRVALGVLAGLVVGKPLGIMAAAAVAVKMRLAVLPAGVSWRRLHGCAWLGGIGFTMSLFMATLAFDGTPLLAAAKTGIVAGSIVAVAIAAAILGRAPWSSEGRPEENSG